jgi:hypothetical protein
MRNPLVVILAAIAVGIIGVLLIVITRHRQTPPNGFETNAPAMMTKATPAPTATPTVSNSSAVPKTNVGPAAPIPTAQPDTSPSMASKTNLGDVLTPEEKARLTLDLPNLKDVRKEIARDPHTTPPSLVTFAADLGGKMDEALTSETKASYFFGQLERCALSGKGSTRSVQALCLSDAQRVQDKYKSLKNDYDHLQSQAPAEVVKMSKIVNQL